MADLTARDDGIALADALRSLPLETPERSAWPALAARLAEPRQRARRASRWPYALAAVALLVLALLPRGGMPTGDIGTTPQAVASNSASAATPATTQLATLMNQSAQLERLLAAASDDGASSGSTTALGLQMEDSLQRLDASLGSDRLSDKQQLSLWQQRVNLLRQIASLETSRHYYAAEGRNLDVALVSAY
jgi:hypothetical protein